MTDLLLSTPEEFRAVVSSHLYRNLDTVRGYLVDSQNTFLRQRLGQPLIQAMLQHYTNIKPIVPDPSECDDRNYELLESDPWAKLIQLSQRCIAYDGLYRSAGIRRVSDNDMGINVAESENFASVDKDRFSEYKIDLYKGAHSASDMLLTQLQDWEREAATAAESNDESNASQNNDENGESNVDTAPVPEDSPEGSSPDDPTLSTLLQIIQLWRQSPTYPLTDGLLFTTATEFNTYVNIQQSLDKFVELLPDIRYCQELHLEAEIGSDLLAYLQQGHREGTLTPSGEKAYQKLQRTLSLYVEARSPMFKRQDARDEAAGYMRLTNNFITAHQLDFDRKAMSTSPLFALHMWPRFDQDGHPLLPDGTPMLDAEGNPLEPDFDEHGHPIFPALDEHGRPICHRHSQAHHGHKHDGSHFHPDGSNWNRPGCAPVSEGSPRGGHPHIINGIQHDHTHGYPCHHPYDDPDRAGFCETSLI